MAALSQQPPRELAFAGEKPEAVRTHLRDALIVPEMIGSVIGVYNGKTFNQARRQLLHRIASPVTGVSALRKAASRVTTPHTNCCTYQPVLQRGNAGRTSITSVGSLIDLRVDALRPPNAW